MHERLLVYFALSPHSFPLSLVKGEVIGSHLVWAPNIPPKSNMYPSVCYFHRLAPNSLIYNINQLLIEAHNSPEEQKLYAIQLLIKELIVKSCCEKSFKTGPLWGYDKMELNISYSFSQQYNKDFQRYSLDSFYRNISIILAIWSHY